MTFISKKTLATLVLALAPLSVLAQGKIAVVNLQEAILQSDVAQARLAFYSNAYNANVINRRQQQAASNSQVRPTTDNCKRQQPTRNNIRCHLTTQCKPASTLGMFGTCLQ